MNKAAARYAAWSIAIPCICFLGLCGWQIYSTIASNDLERRSAASEWARVSSSRAHFLTLYEALCEQHIAAEPDHSKVNRPLTFKECAEQLARDNAKTVGLSVDEAASLGKAMEIAVNRVEVPVPLRWL